MTGEFEVPTLPDHGGEASVVQRQNSLLDNDGDYRFFGTGRDRTRRLLSSFAA